MKFDFRESRIISNGNIIKSKYRPMWRPCATARRDNRAAVGWAWTGRNLILDEALLPRQLRISINKSRLTQSTIHIIDLHMKLAIFWRGYEFLLTTFSVDHRATTVGAIGGPSDILVASGHVNFEPCPGVIPCQITQKKEKMKPHLFRFCLNLECGIIRDGDEPISIFSLIGQAVSEIWPI